MYLVLSKNLSGNNVYSSYDNMVRLYVGSSMSSENTGTWLIRSHFGTRHLQLSNRNRNLVSRDYFHANVIFREHSDLQFIDSIIPDI